MGLGTTYVTRIFTNIGSGNSSISFSSTLTTFDSSLYTFDMEYITYSGGISTSNYFGYYSWGKINLGNRINPQVFN